VAGDNAITAASQLKRVDGGQRNRSNAALRLDPESGT
jgi:hypothetical protein